MKIITFGAAGAVGSRVVREALSRGHTVTAVDRDADRLSTLPDPVVPLPLDVADTDQVAQAMAGQDAAISAIRPPVGHERALVDLTWSLLHAGRLSDTHLVVVGGAASLRIPDGSGHTVLSKPGFLPVEVRPIAQACADQQRMVLDHPHTDWSHVCPAAMMEPGERTGRYRQGEDTLVVGPDGESRISMEDFAVALVDEAETLAHARQSFTVGW